MKIRLLAFITALSMTFSLFSASSFAESEDVMSELPVATEEPVQNTVLPSETPASIPDATEVPVQETEEPFETPVSSEIPEEPVPSEEPLPVEEPEESPAPSPEPSPEPEEEEAEEEKEEEPQLFPGMPEGFSLSEEQLARKQALSEPGGVLSQLQNAVEGQEYETGTLFFSYENEEFAIMTAEAYGAELLCCEYGIALICLPDGISVLQAVEAAADMTNTLPAVEPNFIIEQWPDCGLPMLFMAASPYGISNEPLTKKEWSDWQESADPDLDQSSGRYQYYHEMIDTYTAWGVTRGSSGVKVAILDGGVFTEHEDLNCSSIPYFSRASYSASSHATNVAGIIGATYGNYAGGAGIAPGVTLESYDVFAGSLGGTEALLCIAINAAVSNGADIINLSLGSYRYSDTEQKCINDAVSAGVLIVAAAGNDGQNTKCYPAACKNVVSVAAVGRDGTRANFSNGGDWVTLSAPGVSMYSAYSGTGVYGELSGTSQAAPVVSGAAALYMSAMGDGNGDVNGDGVRNAKDVTQTVEALKGSCTRSSGLSSGMGAGVVNAAKLLGKASLKLNFRLSKDGYEVTSGNGCIVVRSDDRTAKLYIDPSTLDGETETPLTENTAYYIAYTVDSASPTVSDALSYAATFDEETGEYGILLAPLGSGKHTVKAVIQNGEGNVSKIFSCTFTLRINETVSEDEQSGEEVPGNLYVTGPELIGIGKSGQLRATLTGITGAVTWKSSDTKVATVSDTGKVTIKSKASHGDTVTVTASCGALSAEFPVTVISPVSSVKLKASQQISAEYTRTLKSDSTVYSGNDITVLPSVSLANSAYRLDSSRVRMLLSWKSSDASVAEAVENEDGSCTVKPLKSGTVTIKASATDGSGIKASFKLIIELRPELEYFTVTPSTETVARGKTVSFKTSFYPEDAYVAPSRSTAVVWETDAGASITSRGMLTVPSSYKGDTVTVYASLKTDPSKNAAIQINVTAPTKSVSITADETFGDTRSKGVLQSVLMYTVAVENRAYDEYAPDKETAENLRTLEAVCRGSTASVRWKSSKNAVVSVENGILTAHKAGTATITATATDGTGKSASVKVKVIVPASGITAGNKRMNDKNLMLGNVTPGTRGSVISAKGRSEKLIARCESLYGTPGIKKVSWSVDDESYLHGARINSSGVLTIPADYPERVLSEYGTITVYAGTTDGTEKYDELTVYVVDPTTITGALKPEKAYTLYTSNGSSATTVAPETMNAGKYYRNSSGKQYSGKIFFYSDSVLEAFTVTPSDYAVIVGYSAYEYNGQQMYYKTSKGKLYPVYSADVLITRSKTTANYSKRSSVSVKFKAADGTGKYATVTAYYYY